MLEAFKDSVFQKRILWFNALIPITLIIVDFFSDQLGANPPEAIIRTTGVVALVFLILSLMITPVSHIFKQSWLIKHRRALGLFGFYYAIVHLLSYSVFDKELQISKISEDILDRPFILLGFLAFLLLIPLAVTSTNDMIKRLGAKRWKRLHKLVYLIVPLVVAHFWLIVKSDLYYPILFAAMVVILLLLRLRKSSV